MDKSKSKLSKVSSLYKAKSTTEINDDNPEKFNSPETNSDRSLFRNKSKMNDSFDGDARLAKEFNELETLSFDEESPCSDNVQVCVRIRPLLRDEREKNESYSWTWSQNTITQTSFPKRRGNQSFARSVSEPPGAVSSASSSGPPSYAFDHLYYPDHTNEDIFSSVVQKIVRKAMLGYHGSVFSYGQTSSGKTFTMNGTSKQPGLIPQAIYMCFDSVGDYRDREFLFRVSYLEIYNETVHDLLNPDIAQIRIQHDPKLGTVLSGVKEQVVMSPEQVIALLQGGEAYRHVGTTDMNQKSSRAHTLFKLIIESKALPNTIRGDEDSSGATDPIRVSTLNLVDLAGSENAKMTNSKGERAREAKHINQSLLTLSTIIHRLCDESVAAASIKSASGSELGGVPKKSQQHLPYRDSKLTRILQTALSGNSLISIICTISPTMRCVEESNNTLKFATRAKTIRMEAKVNESMDDKTLLRVYRQEIEDLKAKLRAMESMMTTSVDETRTRDESEIDPPVRATGAGDDESDVDADNQLIMLQMIEHMERLILKGEEQAKRDSRGSGSNGKTGSNKAIAAGSAAESAGGAGARRATVLVRKKSSGVGNSSGYHRSQSTSSIPSSTGTVSAISGGMNNKKTASVETPSIIHTTAESVSSEPTRALESSSTLEAVIEEEGLVSTSTTKDSTKTESIGVDSQLPTSTNVSPSAPQTDPRPLSTVAQRKKDIEDKLRASKEAPAASTVKPTTQAPVPVVSNVTTEAVSAPTNLVVGNAIEYPQHKSPSGESETRVALSEGGSDDELEEDEVECARESDDFFAQRAPRPSLVYDQQKGRNARQRGELRSGVEFSDKVDDSSHPLQQHSVRKSSSWSISRNGVESSEDDCSTVEAESEVCLATTSSGATRRDSKISSVASSRLQDLLATSPRDVSLHAAAVTSSESAASMLKDKDKDPVLEGVSQMLQILKQHVNKHSNKTPMIRSMMGSSLNHLLLAQPGASNPERSEIEEPGNPNSEVAAPLSGLIGGAESEGQNVAPPKDGSLEEELLLELKMKDADNKFLHEELRKLRDNLREKESMLAMLTEGLKEVEINQEHMLAANSSLSGELDLMHKAYGEVEAENQMLRGEVNRLVTCLEAREKQFFEVTGRTREEEEF